MLDGDSADFRVQQNAYINMQDFRFGPTSDKGFAEQLEAVGSTMLIVNGALPIGITYCIGRADDFPNRREICFLWNANGNHGIFCYDYVLNTINTVLLSSEVTGGLNFDKYHLIHSARVENGCVYWTDNFNEPRRIDINAGIKMNQGLTPPVVATVPTGLTTVPFTAVQAAQGLGIFQITYTPPSTYPYGAGVFAQVIRVGSGGNQSPSTTIQIPLDWSIYNPAMPNYLSILANGFINYFTTIVPKPTSDWSVSIVGVTIIVFINGGWNMGTGDSAFAPVTAFGLQLYTEAVIYSTDPYIYTVPVAQSVIAWIRRPPGLPPVQVKVMENPLPTTNFIKDEAFEFSYRYQYRGFEFSTLSALSKLAGFNEQDPPANTTSLNIANIPIVTNGYLATNFILTPSSGPLPRYGPGVLAKITRAGTAGINAPAIDIPIHLDWTNYPVIRSYKRVVVEGLYAYFSNLPGNGQFSGLTTGNSPQNTYQGGKWYVSYRDGVNPTLNILETWDWGLGDTQFPPTTSVTLTLYTATLPPSKQFNRIDVALPTGEKIEQDVAQVDLVANYLVGGAYFIIRSWKKSLIADASAIIAHNLGTVALSYSFYNNQSALVVDSAYAVKPFDSVPLLCQSIEIAKNRGFLANYKIGYNSSSLTTSLIATPVSTIKGSTIGSAITGEWFQLLYYYESKPNFGFGQHRSGASLHYIIRTTSSITLQPPSPYYYYTVPNVQPPLPFNISTGILYLGPDIPSVIVALSAIDGTPSDGFIHIGSNLDTGVSCSILSQNLTLDFGVLGKAFKANASYQVGITFYDNYQRKGGIVTKDSLLVTTPNTGFSQNLYVTAINWALDNTNSVTEIPVEAYYYSINITKCLRTRFFLESIGYVVYANKDATGSYTFTNFFYSQTLAGLAIDLSFFLSSGLGYVFAAGDIVNVYLAGAYYSLSIIGQSSKYLIAELHDIGPLSASSLSQFEIYTLYNRQANEPIYEVGEIYPITNPGTPTRIYSYISGSLAGDVFLIQLQNSNINYVSEAMSPNNKHYKLWLTDAGRPNFTDSIGQVNKSSSIAFSNTFIAGSQNNGLSTFDALDTADLSPDFGAIMKLQIASKVQKIGTIMLAICSGYSTASIYLSENTLITNTGESIVGQSNAVIGQVHELKGEFGTLNPESVVEFRGNVYWFDVQNGKIIQYADNGMYPISNYKLSRYWKLFSDQYKSMTVQQIEALGDRPFVFATADPHHGEILFTVPKTLAAPPNGFLPDYPLVYPFDIWDGRGKTLVYKLYTDPNRWQGSYSFVPEYSFYLENNLFSFKGGNLFRHNETTAPYCNYYGSQNKPSVMFLSNQQINKPKVYNNFSVEGNAAPSLVYFMSLYEYLQSSDLIKESFSNKEGVFYSAILRNKLDPQFNHNFPVALIAGEKMRTTALYIWAQWDATTGIVQIKFCNIGYTLSLGQKV